MLKKEQFNFLQAIDAVLPVYDELGNNVCMVFFANGSHEQVPMPIEHFKREWAYAYNVHIGSRRLWARGHLSLRTLNPLVITMDIALVPVKTRFAVGVKDGCYGCVRLGAIKAYNNTVITLQGGAKIPYLSSQETLISRLRKTRLLCYAYKEELMMQQIVYKDLEDPDGTSVARHGA